MRSDKIRDISMNFDSIAVTSLDVRMALPLRRRAIRARLKTKPPLHVQS